MTLEMRCAETLIGRNAEGWALYEPGRSRFYLNGVPVPRFVARLARWAALRSHT